MAEHFTCPRRNELFAYMGNVKEGDSWSRRDGQRCCTYCGSIHQDDFMELVEGGASVGPCDKNYKCYLNEALDTDDLGRQKAKWLIGKKAQSLRENMQRSGHGHTVEEIETALQGYWDDCEAPMSGRHIGKFYYPHLTMEQRERFVWLYNQGAMTIGYPGHFYVLPYFARPDTEAPNGTDD